MYNINDSRHKSIRPLNGLCVGGTNEWLQRKTEKNYWIFLFGFGFMSDPIYLGGSDSDLDNFNIEVRV